MNAEEEFDYIKLLEDIKRNEKVFEKINNQKEDQNFEMLQKIERERVMRKEAKKHDQDASSCDLSDFEEN